jgi:methionyl aminopeptidase
MPKDPRTGFLIPGAITPMRGVPKHIARPEYVGKKSPTPWTGGDVRSASEIELIRESGRIAADAIELVGSHCKPGITTEELDLIAHDYIISQNAYPSTLGYRGFPKSCCTSVNEVICHGIPDDTVLESGDIINIDITAFKNGFHGDSNKTFLVGEVQQDIVDLVNATKTSLERAMAAALPGRAINIIGRTIESYAKRFNYGVVRDFTGHGIGESFHSGLVIPHYDAAPQYATEIQPGMVFTIEPMLTLGGIDWQLWPDDWTVVTSDHSITAQFEHTMAVTEQGVDILTLSTTEIADREAN